MPFSRSTRIALWVKVAASLLLVSAFIYHLIDRQTLRHAQTDFIVASIKNDLPGMERALKIQWRELCASWFLTKAERERPCAEANK